MKKLFLILILVLFLMGCASLKESEFTKHDSQWASWSHMKFSIWGYKNPTKETSEKSIKEGWWGEPVPYVPAK